MSEWISVEAEKPDPDKECWYWIVPKTEEETYHDSSGKPIISKMEPCAVVTKWQWWSSLTKATHWQPYIVPEPPQEKD